MGTRDTALQHRDTILPAVVFAALVTLCLGIWRLDQRGEEGRTHLHTHVTAEQTARRLEEFLAFRLALVEQLQAAWQEGLVRSEGQFRARVRAIQARYPSFQAINWVDPEGIIRWVVPEAGNLPAKNRDLHTHPTAGPVFAQVERTGEVWMTPPLELFQGGRGVAAYYPLLHEGRLTGYLNAVFRITPAVDACLQDSLDGHFSVVLRDGGTEAYRAVAGDLLPGEAYAATAHLVVCGRTWTMVLTPVPALVPRPFSPINLALFGFGVVVSAGLAGATRGMMRREAALQHSLRRLAESEAQHRQFVDFAPLGIAALDTDGHVYAANLALQRLTGAPNAEALLGRSVQDLPIGDHPPAMAALERCKQTGISESIDVTYTTAWQRHITVRFNLAALRDASGEITGLLVMAEDVTAQKHTERELRRRLQLDRLLAKVSADIVNLLTHEVDEGIDRALGAIGEFVEADRCHVFEFTPDGTRQSMTHQWCAPGIARTQDRMQDRDSARFPWLMARLRRGEAIAVQRVADLPPAAIAERAAMEGVGTKSIVIAPMMQAGTLIGHMGFISTRKEEAWSEETIYLLHIMAEVLTNALHRRRMESALRESEAQLRAMFDHAAVGIAHIDLAGRFLRVNPRLCEMAGRAEADLCARTSFDITHPDDLHAHREKTQHMLEGQLETYSVEQRLRRPDGTPVWVRVTVSLARESAGDPRHFIAVFEDLTDVRRADADRRALERQVQHAQKLESLGVLAGGIAHDFNNLLMGVLGNAGLALLDLPADSAVRPHVAAVEAAALRAADLTGQLLAYSGKGSFIVEPLDLSALAQEMSHLLGTVISKKAELTYDLAPDLPAVKGDATQIRQIVMNLITNASDALEDGAGGITLRTGVTAATRAYLADTYLDDELTEGSYVYVEVADTGVGMNEATRANIFDPFYTTKFTGRGLGLAAVLGIVRAHRGAIRVDSAPHQGTTFRVLFPTSALIPRPPAPAVDGTTPWRGTGTVLVVDDEEQVREVARHILERTGFSVITAQDGPEAVEMFRERNGELAAVLLDMTMPSMGGDETYQALRELRPDVRVLLSSGYNEHEVATGFGEDGPGGFIQKPYRQAALVSKLRELLER